MNNKRRYWGVLSPLPAAVIEQIAKQSEELGLEGRAGLVRCSLRCEMPARSILDLQE